MSLQFRTCRRRKRFPTPADAELGVECEAFLQGLQCGAVDHRRSVEGDGG